ncbi:MAG: transglycosylase domain-containing protein [Alphaproteobacteria bacterium]
MTRLDQLIQTTKADAARFFETFADDAPLIFEALLIAEDHRAERHHGIDWFSLLRALVLFPRTRKLRGVSTIEQQYVRTVFKRRGSLIWCKLRELWLSWRLAGTLCKQEIWAAYLMRAYYGAHQIGYGAARRSFCPQRKPLSIHAAAEITACLKYPKPGQRNAQWRQAHQTRVQYILTRYARLTSGAAKRPTSFPYLQNKPL